MGTEPIPCMLMRGGTSKGAYFLFDDLPTDPAERDDLVLRIVGSPDPRQIDGIGGAHELTTKVAIVGPASRPDADVDYLFLQPVVDKPTVSDIQTCGNLLAGVGQFAIERGLVSPSGDSAAVRINMLNTNSVATARFPLSDGRPVYSGDTEISGVPGTAAAVRLDFEGIAGSTCGELLPSGRRVDMIEGIACTLVDNGMPVVVMRASDLGITGYESCDEIEGNASLRKHLEAIRMRAGELMNLGDVTKASVPKLTMVAEPRTSAAICTRTMIPHRCHDAIGVLGAVSVATAAMYADSPAHTVCALQVRDALQAASDVVLTIEHPTGTFDAALTIENGETGPNVTRAGIIRTARLLFDGVVYPRP